MHAEPPPIHHFLINDETVRFRSGDVAADGADIRAVFDRISDPCSFSDFRSPWPLFHDRAQSLLDHVRVHLAYFPGPKLSALRLSDEERYDGSRAHVLPICIYPFFPPASNGHFGLCRWMVEGVDVIPLLHGGNIPYLLRRIKRELGLGGEEVEATSME